MHAILLASPLLLVEDRELEVLSGCGPHRCP